ncbi:MAG TPA: ATP synthase subunit I [Bacillales bacterium]|nr:ATP synthase subunit I [Bacillales bacterium]
MMNEMADLDRFRRLTLILSCTVLAILAVLWFFLPARAVIAGLILGGLISLYNVLYLARRVRMAGQSVIDGHFRLIGTGLMNRLLMVGLGIMFVYRFPEWIDARFFVFGLLISYVLMVVAACVNTKKGNIKREGRVTLGGFSDN